MKIHKMRRMLLIIALTTIFISGCRLVEVFTAKDSYLALPELYFPPTATNIQKVNNTWYSFDLEDSKYYVRIISGHTTYIKRDK